MIPQITEIGFPSYATLNSATVTLAEMGDRTITTQVKIDGDIVPDFSGWELEFKGERFVLPTKEPQAAKDTSSRRSIIDLTFSSWAVNELKRYFFVEMTSITSGTAIADKYKASLGLNLENFVTAFNNVLDYYFNGQIYMDLFGAGTGIYSQEPSFVEIDYTHIWDVLQKVYEIYDVRWTFAYDSVNQRYLIKVGYPAAEIDDHDFEYGYSGGLLRFERQVQDYDITNLLLGRGGEKNLPYRYFKKTDPQNPEWAADPDAIPELANIYFENLRDINFRRYVQGWKTNPNRILEEGDSVETYDTERAATDWAYAKGHTDDRFNPVEYVKDDASIALYGERWGALENNDDIFPTIQGIEVSPFGRIDQVVDVEPVTTDDIEAMAADAAEITNVQGASKTEWINYNSRITVEINGPDFTVPVNKVGNLTMVGTWLDSLQYGKRNNHQETIAADSAVRSLVSVDTTNSYVVAVSNSNAHEYPISGIAPGSYHYKMHIEVKAEFEQTMYDSVSVTVGADSFKLTTSEGTANAWKPTFDIWVKNIWNTTQASGESDTAYAARVWEPILGDRTGKEAAVAFSTGFLSISEDYNFVIASVPVVDRTKTINGVSSEWRITLIKSDAEYEATGKYIPNADTGGNASAGDYFFFTGIDMPHAYVLWAEERLNAYKETELAKLKQINPTWIIQIDKVRANTKEQGELEFLADRFASGAKLRVKDKRFTNNNVLTLYVQTITYTWQQPSQGKPYLVPDIEVVLSDKVAAVESPIDRLEGSVDMIQTSYAKISDIESVVRRVASPIFLKKTGESERSLSPTRFSSVVASENFRQGDIGGEGWGAYVDGEGHTVLEADTVVVRKDMRVNTLTVNQIAYLGGKQIISAAAMECNRVEEVTGGYKCYFDQKQGSIANLFKVNDVVLGQVWNADESEQRYYKRKVIAIDSDSITLSSDIADGTGVPQPKDIMVQYGSYTDTSRQYVIIRDVIGGGYERMLSGLTSVYTDGTEYYFAGRQSGSTPRWFVGDALGQYASYQNGVLNIAGRLAVTTQIDTGSGSYTALSDYLSNLQDQIDGNVQTWYASGVPTLNNYPANTWTTVEDKNNHIGDLYYDSATGKAYRFMYDGTNEVYLWTQIADEDIAAALALAQQNQTAIAGLQYLKAATNQGTLVQGGLVLTSMIQLGQTEQGVYKVYSGINGIMDTSALGNGIAAWYGGQMADKVADNTLTNYAKSLFRFDGSGYLASGNIRWDLNGNGQIPGISWSNGTITLSPDIYLQGGDRLTQIVDAVNRMYTQFAYDSHDNIVIAPTNAFYIPTDSPQYPIAGKVALYYDYDGFYSETPSGGVADVYKLTLMKGATSLGVFDPAGPADQMIDIATAFSGYATQSWVSANFNNYVLPTASASVLGGIKLGTGLSIDASGVVSVTGQTQGTVTRVDLGTTQYSPDASGVVGLPAYPTTLPASDVYAWAKASTKPTYALNEITGTGDLQAIEALSGTSGLLKKTAANTWSLDTNTYLTASNHAALTLKVGTITIGNNYNSLEAKTYTITAQNLTDTIGSTTYAAYNADGYVPTTRKVNGHALSSDVTVTKGDVGLGNVENTALSTWAGSSNITTLGTITTGVWHGTAIANDYLVNSSVTINSKSVSLGGSVSLNLDDIGDGTAKTWSRIVFTDTAQTVTGAKKLKNISLLNIPTSISSADVESGKVYLYSDTGSYSETPSGGGTATVHDLKYLKNGVLQNTYNLGVADANLNVTIGWSDLTPDSTHRFVSDAEKSTWNSKVDAAYVTGQITALNLGTASQKDYTTSIAQNNTNLPTSGAVYSAIAAAVTSALHYRGISSVPLTDGGTETAVIGGVSLVAQSGDVVIYGGFEFLWENNVWNKLGDDTSYALKTIQIAGDGTYITGGGQLTQNQTLTLSSSVIASLGKADTAVQPAALGDYLPLIGGTMSNTNLVTNMNADLLDGLHSHEQRRFNNAQVPTGSFSFAAGYNSQASGIHSVTLGRNAIASAQGAMAIAYNSEASENYAVALGVNAKAAGISAVALSSASFAGLKSGVTGKPYVYLVEYTPEAITYGGDTVYGVWNRYNDASSITITYEGTNYTISWPSASPAYWRALNVVKIAGDMREPSADAPFNSYYVITDGLLIGTNVIQQVTELTTGVYAIVSAPCNNGASWTDSRTMLTTGPKIALWTNTSAASYNGTSSISLGYNSKAVAQYTLAVGAFSVASNPRAIAMGYYSTASGSDSFALGYGSVARGQYSIALGQGSIAFGGYSVALGVNCISSGNYSISAGLYSVANGAAAIAIGDHSIATTNNSIAIGSYLHTSNTTYQTVLGRYNVDTSDALIVGWGTNSARANIMTLSTAGALSLAGNITLDASSTNRNLNWKTSSNETLSALRMYANGLLFVGETQISNQHNTYIGGSSLYMRSGTTSDLKQIVFDSNGFHPVSDLGSSLGTNTYRWDNLYLANNAYIDGDCYLDNNLRISGDVFGDLTPGTNNANDIGSSSSKWKDLHLAGNASIGGTLSVTGVASLESGAEVSAYLTIPTAAPSNPGSGNAYLYAGSGAYSEDADPPVEIASVVQTTTSQESGGTNIITVSLTNGVRSSFKVKNGAQGNSGYTGAAGELEIVNNFTGGATKALSAEMGKELHDTLVNAEIKDKCLNKKVLATLVTGQAPWTGFAVSDFYDISAAEFDKYIYTWGYTQTYEIRAIDASDNITTITKSTFSPFGTYTIYKNGPIPTGTVKLRITLYNVSTDARAAMFLGSDKDADYLSWPFVAERTAPPVSSDIYSGENEELQAIYDKWPPYHIDLTGMPSVKVSSKNLFALKDVVFDSVGTASPYYPIFTSGFMPVTEGHTYTFSYKSSTFADKQVLYFDSNKTFISRSLYATSVAPTDAAYAKVVLSRFNDISLLTEDSQIQFEESAYPTSYEPYFIYESKKDCFPMADKSFATLGDSFTAGGVWAAVAASLMEATLVYNAAVSGGRWSGTTNADLTKQADALIASGTNPDYIFITLGVNDVNNSTPIGSIVYSNSTSSMDLTTFIGGAQNALIKLKNAFSDAVVKIGWTPAGISFTGTTDISAYITALKNVATMYGVQYIETRCCDITPWVDAYSDCFEYGTSGGHPTNKGQQKIGVAMARILSSNI